MDVRPEDLSRFTDLVVAAQRATELMAHIDDNIDVSDLSPEEIETLESAARAYQEAFAAGRDLPIEEPGELATFLEQALLHTPDGEFRYAVGAVMWAHLEQTKSRIDDGQYGHLERSHIFELARLVGAARPYGGAAVVHADALGIILEHATHDTARAFLLADKAGVFEQPGPDARLSTEHRAGFLPEADRRWHYVPAALEACPPTRTGDEFHARLLEFATAHLDWARADLRTMRNEPSGAFASDPAQGNWWVTIYTNFTIQLARAARQPFAELLGNDTFSLN